MMMMLQLLVLGGIGMVLHWFKKWSRNETDCGLTEYIKGHWKHTVGAVISMFVAILAVSATVHDPLTVQDIALAVLAGYGSDSMVNKAPDS